MKKEDLKNKFLNLRDEIIAIIDFQELIDWYSISTKKDVTLLDEMLEISEKKLETIETSNYSFDTVNGIIQNKESYDEFTVKEAYIIYDRIKRRKDDEKAKSITEGKIKTQRAFAIARENGDFSFVKNNFRELVACFQNKSNKLNQYEYVMKDRIVDLSLKEVDSLFSQIKENVIPLLITQKSKKRQLLLEKNENTYQIVEYLIGLLKIRPEHLEVKDYKDNFMTSFGTQNVKVALNLQERNFVDFLRFACHELGHALYEQNNSKVLDGTFLSGGASTTFHEGIAYFFEHYVGDNIDFQNSVAKRFYNKTISSVEKERSPIRNKSNDIEYPIHVLIRYELEKDLINGKLDVNDLQEAWNERYKQYLGINIKNDNEGILQDPHWFRGQFGYFPSYVIGRAFAAQLYSSLSKRIDFAESLKKENLSNSINWLTDNIFTYGMSKNPKELIKSSTSEDFNTKYYIDELSSER